MTSHHDEPHTVQAMRLQALLCPSTDPKTCRPPRSPKSRSYLYVAELFCSVTRLTYLCSSTWDMATVVPDSILHTLSHVGLDGNAGQQEASLSC